MSEDIGTLAVRIAMEDSSFQQGIQNLKRSIGVVNSSFKESISGIKDWGKNLDNLKSNSQALGEKIQLQSKIVSEYSDKLQKSQKTLEDNSVKMLELRNRVLSSKEAYEQSKVTLGANAEETQKLGKAYKDLSNEYSNQESKVRNNEKSIQGYTIQLNNANTKLKSFQNELKKSNEQINNFKLKSLSESFETLGNKFKSVGEQMSVIGTGMVTKVTAPIVAGFGLSVKSASSFEHQMADIRKELVASGESTSEVDSTMKEMSSDSLKWGADFGQSTDDINAGLLTLKKDGYSGKEAIDDMSTALYTARGANENLFDVINTLGGSLEAYGMKTENAAKNTQNMAHIADSFSYVANHTKASVTSLGEGFSVAGQTLSAMHQPLEVTAAAIGELASSNIDASTAATALKAGFVNLTKPSDEMSAAMQRMKLNVVDAKGQMKDLPTILDDIAKGTKGWTEQERNNAVATVFGKESLASWNALLNKGGDNLRELANGAKNSTGEVKRLSDAMKDTPENKFKELEGSVKALGVAFGQDILPIFTPFIQGITNMIKGFSQLNDSTKKIIITFAGTAAATGAFVFGTSKIIDGVSKVDRKISGLFKYMAEHDIGTKFATMFSKVPTIPSTIFSGLTTGLNTTGGAISTFIFGPWNLLKDGLKSLPGLVSSLSFAGVAEKLTGPFKKIPGLFTGIFANMKGSISKIPGLFGILKNSLTGFGTTVVALGPKVIMGLKKMFSLKGIMDGAKAALGLFTNPWGALILAIVAGVGAIIANWGKITTFAHKIFGGGTTQIFTQFKQVFTQIGTDIKADVTAVWTYIGPTITNAVTQIKAFWDAVWPEIKEVFVEVWDVMKVVIAPIMTAMYVAISTGIGVIKGTWSPAWSAIKDTLKTVWDAMTGVIKVAWDIISGVVKVGLDLLTGHWSKAWDDFKSIFSNVWSDLKSSVSKVAKDALDWGKDIIQGIIDGIKSGVKSLEDAVSNVAKTIWKYLHHSVPEEGPLKDDDTYMPDMLKNMADGIKKNKGIVTKALKELSSDMSDNLKVNMSAKLGTTNITSSKNNSNGDDSKSEQKNGQDMNAALGKGLTDSQNKAMAPVKALNTSISDSMSKLVQTFSQNGQDADSNLGTGITTNTSAAVQPLKAVISTATDNINKFVNDAVGHGQDTDTNLGTGITNDSNQVISSMNNVTTTVGTNLNTFATNSVKYGQDTDTNISTGITNTSSSVTGAINTLVSNISNIFKEFVSSCNSIGQSIVNSIGDGMKSSEDNVVSIAHELTQKVIQAFTGPDGFDIHSPSRKLFQIGSYVIQGFVNGLSSQDALGFFKNKIMAMLITAGAMSGNIAEWIMAGIMAEGAPISWFLPLEMIASRESGNPGQLGTGNPGLVNSIGVGNEFASGLMQVLPSTFRSFFGSDDGIFNPIMSVRAAIREIRESWGDNPFNIPGLMDGNGYLGYETGTRNASRGWHLVGENGPELAWFGGGEKVLNSRISTAFMDKLSTVRELISSLVGNVDLSAVSIKSNGINANTANAQSALDIAKSALSRINLNGTSSSTQQIIIPINFDSNEVARVIAKPSDKIQGRNIKLAMRGRGL